jgi:hypothetical protein
MSSSPLAVWVSTSLGSCLARLSFSLTCCSSARSPRCDLPMHVAEYRHGFPHHAARWYILLIPLAVLCVFFSSLFRVVSLRPLSSFHFLSFATRSFNRLCLGICLFPSTFCISWSAQRRETCLLDIAQAKVVTCAKSRRIRFFVVFFFQCLFCSYGILSLGCSVASRLRLRFFD